jgi:hypothetical protein
MKWLAPLVFFFLLGATIPANPPGEDYSDPELVSHYIWLECDALQYSYEVMRAELNNLSDRYLKCISIQDNQRDNLLGNPWYGLSCVFINQTFEFRYTHIMSVVEAYNLMCNDEGRKEKRYEVDY